MVLTAATLTRQEHERLTADAGDWRRFVASGRPSECWPWIGSTHPKGYGEVFRRYGAGRRRVFRVHRLVWIAEYGAIPRGFQIDHRCRNKVCCNPRHLQLLTATDHARKSASEGWQNWVGDDARCRYGHAERYWYERYHTWRCRACIREQARARRAAKWR
jgi:HNH endonuclease